MYTINMILDVLVSAILVIESVLCLPFATLAFHFDAKASVFESGDNMYTVIWSTSLPGTGYVTYNYDGVEYTVTDTENAAIRTTDMIHSVRIPKSHLDNNTYTYHSQQISVKRAYVAVKGRTISSGEVKFNGYSGQEKIHALVLSDIHENPYPVDKAAASFENEPDLLIMNGDEVSYMTSVVKFKQVLSYAYRFSNGSIPVIYTRGNHENRGEYGSKSVDIFKTTTQGLYYTCNYGPVQFLALDTGEDKDDSDWTYSGLVDCTSYIATETEWLKTVALDENAEYRIAVGHMPSIQNRYGFDWTDLLSGMGVDLLVSAHKHRVNYEFNKGKVPFCQMIDGGKTGDTGYIATMLTFSDGQVYAESFDEQHNRKGEYTYIINR